MHKRLGPQRTLFLKLEHPESQVNHKNHSFAVGWDKLHPVLGSCIIYIYIPTSELVFIQDWQILSKCLRKKPKFGFYWQIKPTRFLYQKKNWQKNVKLTRNCSERHSLAIDVLHFPIMFSKWRWRIDLPRRAKYLGFSLFLLSFPQNERKIY